jgi:hypothetical protein
VTAAAFATAVVGAAVPMWRALISIRAAILSGFAKKRVSHNKEAAAESNFPFDFIWSQELFYLFYLCRSINC